MSTKGSAHKPLIVYSKIFIGFILTTILMSCAEEVEVVGDDPGFSEIGFNTVSQAQWTKTSVRKVLHTFAYGGLATSGQVTEWANMSPQDAIVKMLSFTYVNNKLSPAEGLSTEYSDSLAALQDFWGGDDVTNPMPWNKRPGYSTLTKKNLLNVNNLQRTWIQAVNTRGINPFLHKIAFYLTNYQMAIVALRGKIGLTRSYYDEVTANLVLNKNFTEIISAAAKSAAVAKRYNHSSNIYSNEALKFSGNDDFAREYFQLFFRLQGETEDADYHESVTIENNAKLLTGMGIDKKVLAYGGAAASDHWWVAPINFTDHVDISGRELNNLTNHHADCLEILREQICGLTAEEKIDMLSPIVASHPEVLDNLPVFIIQSLADDRLTEEKKARIRDAWKNSNDNLLIFLRAYAISTTFHSADTVKFRTTFNRNLTLHNAVVLNNEESFLGRAGFDIPHFDMRNQDGEVFLPKHDVFGGQTGPQAADSTNVFKEAYSVATETFGSRLSLLEYSYYTDSSLTELVTWNKNWSKAIPKDVNGQYLVKRVADWLWDRLIADGGKNFDIMARSQVLALLARGEDFGYAVTVLAPEISTDPNTNYSSSQLNEDAELLSVMNLLAEESMDLDNPDDNKRKEANRRVNFAVNFISALPYTFALEGQ